MENYEATFFFFLPGKSTDLGLAEAMEWKGQFLAVPLSSSGQYHIQVKSRPLDHPDLSDNLKPKELKNYQYSS